MQIYSLNLFRAIAIVLVVFSHADEMGALAFDTFPEMVIWNLLSGATTIFIFISGFLFHHVFLRRFDYPAFLGKKLRDLVIPYVFLTFVALAAGCALIPVQYFQDPFTLGAYMLASGHATLAYWFIPFAITLFAMAPLHVKFAGLGVRIQLAIVGVFLVAALLVHRPPLNLDPVQNLVYYTPTYLIGMMCSQHRKAIDPLLARFTWPLLGAVIGFAVLEALMGVSGNYGKPMFEFRGIDLMLLQKICLCLFMITFLRRFETQRSRMMDLLADTSFAIFFIHPIIQQLIETASPLSPALMEESWPRYVVLATLCLTISAAIAWLAKRTLGARSRLLTGY